MASKKRKTEEQVSQHLEHTSVRCGMEASEALPDKAVTCIKSSWSPTPHRPSHLIHLSFPAAPAYIEATIFADAPGVIKFAVMEAGYISATACTCSKSHSYIIPHFVMVLCIGLSTVYTSVHKVLT